MHPNEALLRALYDAQGRGDIDAYLGMLSDAIVFHIPGRSELPGTTSASKACAATSKRFSSYRVERFAPRCTMSLQARATRLG